MRDLAPGDVLDAYQLVALVARGGMGSVFRAVERATGRTVAIKVPHLAYEADVVFWERFAREERVGLGLSHPNVVAALPPAAEKSRTYLVMEWVEGETLEALLAREGAPFPVECALDVARQACDALAYLHARGIVHRDVKPANLLVMPSGQVKLLDLGIARVRGLRSLSVAGLSGALGTPEYMAPEQLAGRHGDARVDVYALGTVLYRMVTGRFPYEAEDDRALLREKRRTEATPATAHVPELAPGVAALLARALRRDPAARHPTALDLLADLRDPSAVRPPPEPVARRRGERLRAALGSAAAAAWAILR